MPQLRNTLAKAALQKILSAETGPRTTVSFYRYCDITNPQALRDQLFAEWSLLGILGRIYIAAEGINAQLSIPSRKLEQFRRELEERSIFSNIFLKIGLEEGVSFLKLTIKVRKKIVADDLAESEFDMSHVGTHLSPEAFHEVVGNGDAVVIDMRNHYESRIGKFEGAYCPDADTYREELTMVRNYLKGKENSKVLLYCTGGIRCEKASSYLLRQGFKDVNQLSGGIINYAHAMREKEIESKFKGKNFVFDGRMGERVTDDVLSACDQCGAECDRYVNCNSVICNLLFLQCEECEKNYYGCCSQSCREFFRLPEEKQRVLRKKFSAKSYEEFKKRQRGERLREGVIEGQRSGGAECLLITPRNHPVSNKY